MDQNANPPITEDVRLDEWTVRLDCATMLYQLYDREGNRADDLAQADRLTAEAYARRLTDEYGRGREDEQRRMLGS